MFKSITLMVCTIFALAFTGCTSAPTSPGDSLKPIGCAIEMSVTGALAASVATALSCSNYQAIQNDIQNGLGSANFCAVEQAQEKVAMAKKSGKLKGVVGSLVCPMAVNTVLALVQTKVPAAWGCDAAASQSGVAAALSAACIAVVPL